MLFSASPPTHTRRHTLPSGASLFTQHWHRSSPTGHVLLVHGYAEHSGRYGHVATALHKAGYAVTAYDQRGFGRSPGRRALVWSFDTLAQDLHALSTHVHAETKVPLFLLGHSMGGLVVLWALLRHDVPTRGLVLSAPALAIDGNVPRGLAPVAHAVSRYLPALPTVGKVEGGISRDAQVVAEAEADPLNYHGRVPARTGVEMLRVGRQVQTDAARITHPYVLMHGTADAIVAPAGSARFHARSGAGDKTLHRYPGARHELFNEPERHDVMNTVVAWLDAHASV
ncbi:MAG: alpha/beta hydrolase [Bacteroidota bacterium]